MNGAEPPHQLRLGLRPRLRILSPWERVVMGDFRFLPTSPKSHHNRYFW